MDPAPIRRLLRAHRRSPNPALRSAVAAVDVAHRVARFAVNAEYRSIVLTTLVARDQLHQTTALTWPDRYPGIFSACRQYFGGARQLSLLSFGCSTGEEVLTLRRYFPDATITGAEINRRSLDVCRSRASDAKMTFVYPDPDAIARYAPFDAIFCMAVLQRTPHAVQANGTTNLSGIYPFEKFDRQLSEFDAWLRPAGLLVIHHTQYRVADASVAWRYTPLCSEGQEEDRSTLFDRNGARVDHDPRTPRVGSIYVKRSCGTVAPPRLRAE